MGLSVFLYICVGFYNTNNSCTCFIDGRALGCFKMRSYSSVCEVCRQYQQLTDCWGWFVCRKCNQSLVALRYLFLIWCSFLSRPISLNAVILHDMCLYTCVRSEQIEIGLTWNVMRNFEWLTDSGFIQVGVGWKFLWFFMPWLGSA